MGARAASLKGFAAPDVFRLTLALAGAALGVATTALVLAGRSVNISPDAPVHEFETLGRTIVYPAANPAAIVVLALAACGVAVLLLALRAGGRQVRAQRRLARRLAETYERELPGGAIVVRGERPSAMCAGLRRPRIYVTAAALDVLTADELEAVLAHEAHHRRQRDPLRLAVAQVLCEALFFLPPVRRLAAHHVLLTEIDADAAALAAASGDGAPLATAMLQLARAEDGAVGIDAGRVDSLLGRPPGHALPIACAAAVLLAFVVLGLLAMLTARTAASHATLALPVLSLKPCIVALALVPGTLAALAALFLRRR